jgi:hypothetical protein
MGSELPCHRATMLQMVLARVTNVKSGWKSMFMVFTTAAGADAVSPSDGVCL